MIQFGFAKAACVDVETTGTDKRNDAIVSVSILGIDFRADRITRVYGQLFDPQRPIPPRSTTIHGLTQKDVQDKPLFATEAPAMRKAVGKLPVVGYNVEFDIDFMDKGFRDAGLPIIRYNNEFLDLMAKFNKDYGECDSASLDDAARYFGLEERNGMHEAEEDAYMAARVALAMWKTENWE